MKLKYLCLVLLFLIFISASFVSAQNISCKTIIFIDNNNVSLVNYIVYIENFNTKEQIGSLIDSNGQIKLCDDFDKEYIFSIKSLVDNKLYFSKANILSSSENMLKFNSLPISNIHGILMDSYDNLLPDVELEFQCTNSLSEPFPIKTNNFGVFNVKNIPLGECGIIAKYKNNYGHTKINIDNNIDYHVNIIISNQKSNFNILFWLIFIFFILLLFFGIKYIIKSSNKKIQTIEEGNIVVTENMTTIMKTFNDNELKIINFLLSEGGCASQTKIRKNTLIPKTSLHRYIKSLEIRNIIKTFDVGKIKKIELSEFFLNS